ncbi:hypothetical protein [Pseudomonas sp. v388]|nr:hypothetical protein [Pseudomonas sp. v388]
MQTMDDLKNSKAMANFLSRPRLIWGMVIFCAGVTLLTVEAASTLYR